jgi:hypothetical protein
VRLVPDVDGQQHAAVVVAASVYGSDGRRAGRTCDRVSRRWGAAAGFAGPAHAAEASTARDRTTAGTSRTPRSWESRTVRLVPNLDGQQHVAVVVAALVYGSAPRAAAGPARPAVGRVDVSP